MSERQGDEMDGVEVDDADLHRLADDGGPHAVADGVDEDGAAELFAADLGGEAGGA